MQCKTLLLMLDLGSLATHAVQFAEWVPSEQAFVDFSAQ
jgi:hypothetical protein